eukprot:5642779-Pleurochrysis_carterae.AAC.1
MCIRDSASTQATTTARAGAFTRPCSDQPCMNARSRVCTRPARVRTRATKTSVRVSSQAGACLRKLAPARLERVRAQSHRPGDGRANGQAAEGYSAKGALAFRHARLSSHSPARGEMVPSRAWTITCHEPLRFHVDTEPSSHSVNRVTTIYVRAHGREGRVRTNWEDACAALRREEQRENCDTDRSAQASVKDQSAQASAAVPV